MTDSSPIRSTPKQSKYNPSTPVPRSPRGIEGHSSTLTPSISQLRVSSAQRGLPRARYERECVRSFSPTHSGIMLSPIATQTPSLSLSLRSSARKRKFADTVAPPFEEIQKRFEFGAADDSYDGSPSRDSQHRSCSPVSSFSTLPSSPGQCIATQTSLESIPAHQAVQDSPGREKTSESLLEEPVIVGCDEGESLEGEKENVKCHNNAEGGKSAPTNEEPPHKIRKLMEELDTVRREFEDARRQHAEEIQRRTEEIEKQQTELQRTHDDLKSAREKHSEEMKWRRELFNQVQDLRGNIRVLCRVRPAGVAGSEKSESTSVEVLSDSKLSLTYTAPGLSGKTIRKPYSFDCILDETAKQADVYAEVRPMVISVLDGYNVCLFAYGQTGSGKTYTMTGTDTDRGVMYRALHDLFERAEASGEAGAKVTYEISVTILEIYNEQIKDLITPAEKRLDIRQHQSKTERGVSVYVPEATELPVCSAGEIWDLMQTASANRSTGATAMNDASSRSHLVVTILVEGYHHVSGSKVYGRLNLVDLAGSERIQKSEAKGTQLREASNINKSLTELGTTINALISKSSHIPYRNSKLTHLLQDSLGGDGKTLMIVNISAASSNALESMASLEFAKRARCVQGQGASKHSENAETTKLRTMFERSKEELSNIKAQYEHERSKLAEEKKELNDALKKLKDEHHRTGEENKKLSKIVESLRRDVSEKEKHIQTLQASLDARPSSITHVPPTAKAQPCPPPASAVSVLAVEATAPASEPCHNLSSHPSAAPTPSTLSTHTHTYPPPAMKPPTTPRTPRPALTPLPTNADYEASTPYRLRGRVPIPTIAPEDGSLDCDSPHEKENRPNTYDSNTDTSESPGTHGATSTVKKTRRVRFDDGGVARPTVPSSAAPTPTPASISSSKPQWSSSTRVNTPSASHYASAMGLASSGCGVSVPGIIRPTRSLSRAAATPTAAASKRVLERPTRIGQPAQRVVVPKDACLKRQRRVQL
eukprot:Rmarinus@m.15982